MHASVFVKLHVITLRPADTLTIHFWSPNYWSIWQNICYDHATHLVVAIYAAWLETITPREVRHRFLPLWIQSWIALKVDKVVLVVTARKSAAALRTIFLALQQSVHQAGEPWSLRMVPEGSKPHLPVQPGLMRCHHRRRSTQIAWLIHKLNLLKGIRTHDMNW